MSMEGLRDGKRLKCRGCDLGALHCGVAPSSRSKSRMLGSLICSRCMRGASRLIRKTICVSCYNREREVIVGRNAKGTKPINCTQPFPAMVACSLGDDPAMQVVRLDRVVSRTEAVMSLLHREERSVSFGWLGAPIQREFA